MKLLPVLESFPYPGTKVWVNIDGKLRKGTVADCGVVDCHEKDPVTGAKYVRVRVQGFRPRVPQHLRGTKPPRQGRGLEALWRFATQPRWPVYPLSSLSLR